MENLTLEEKAAQVVFPRLGSNMPPPVAVEDDADRVREELDRYAFGGLLVFNADARKTPDVLAQLQRRSRIPLIVATDMEAGLGQQFGGATVFPHAMAFSGLGVDGAAFAERAARVAAREALWSGVHMSLGPVADVHLDPRNPIISIRAFGSAVPEVALIAATYVRACRDEGLLTATKHFPGHGRTIEDSHSTLPVVGASREDLETLDLPPFRACISEGTEAIMPAHVWYPALDPVQRPATFSPAVLHELLREELGFDGLVISDSMRMGAVHDESGTSPSVTFLAAGGDVVLDPVDAGGTVREIVEAVSTGLLPEAHLDTSILRLNRLRRGLIARFGSTMFINPSGALGGVAVGGAEHQELADEIASRAIRVFSGAEQIERIRERHASVAVLSVPSPRSARLTAPFVETVRRHAPGIRVMDCMPEGVHEDDVFAAVDGADLVVVVLFVRPAAWHAYGLTSLQHDLVVRVMQERPTVVAVLGSPDVLASYPGAAAQVCSYSDMKPAQKALADLLFKPTS